MKEDAWLGRKDRIRDAYYAKIVKTPEQLELAEIAEATAALESRLSNDPSTPPAPTGDAAGPAASAAARSARRAAPSPPAASTATSATATALGAASTEPPTSGTSATNTSASSTSDTVWAATPLGFVEHNLSSNIVGPSGQLAPGLPPRVLSSLRALAIGRGEPLPAVIQAIAEFYVEQEDERAEGPLLDALTHYVENQLV